MMIKIKVVSKLDKFISDPHLSHENIIKFERTQFKTIFQHDIYIKSLIIKNTQKNDTLYVLGDIGELTKENMLFWKNLKCKTVLIRGNHDTQKQKLLEAFDVVSDVPIFYNKRILLSHEPLPVTNETINIHGHLHGAYLDSKNHVNLSIHMADYKIWNEKMLEKLVMQKPKISQKFMFEWYADKYIFTTEKSDVIFKKENNLDLEKSRLKQIKEGSLKKIYNKTITNFLKEYPDYKHANYKKFIQQFLLSEYQNNANFKLKDIKDFILNTEKEF